MTVGAVLLRLLRADLRRSRTVSMVLVVLVAVSTTLVATGTALVARTYAATNSFWQQALPPDVVQMHAGPLTTAQVEDIQAWAASQPQVVDAQVLTTLPVPGQQLWIDGVSQAGSVLEPALVVAPERFDLLVDAAGQPVRPAPGEVWLPVHYQAQGSTQAGGAVRVTAAGQVLELRVAGFVRDAQMNPSLVTSKRLVVNAADFERLRPHLAPEQLVELRTAPGAGVTQVMDTYRQAGLPANGISVDATVFKLMNGLSTYLLAAALLLVAGVLSGAMLLALRFALLTALEGDLAEIATLKAIGAPAAGTRRLYGTKYTALSLVGAGVGLAAAFPLTAVLQQPVVLYLGRPSGLLPVVVAPVLGESAVALLVLATSSRVLRRLGRLGAVEMLRAAATGTTAQPRRRRLLTRLLRWQRPLLAALPRRRPASLLRSPLGVPGFLGLRGAFHGSSLLLLGVVALAVAAVSLPAGVLATMESPSFTTYLGAGRCDLRVDVPVGAASATQVEELLAGRADVARHTLLVSERYGMRAPGGRWGSVLVQSGDHEAFPLAYKLGRSPRTEQEVSLSHNQAQELAVTVGGSVELDDGAGVRLLTVTGVYQDITFGGKTAKARLPGSEAPLWQVIYVDLVEPGRAEAVVADLGTELPGVKVSSMAQFTAQTLGATSSQLRTVVRVAAVGGSLLTLVVTALAVVLLVTRERGQVALLRALGASLAQVRRQYLVRFLLPTALGLVSGAVGAQLLGQPLLRVVLAAFGAPGVRLSPDPLTSWVLLPGLVLAAVSGALVLGLRPLAGVALVEQE